MGRFLLIKLCQLTLVRAQNTATLRLQESAVPCPTVAQVGLTKSSIAILQILQPKFLRCHRELWTADPPKSASCWKAPQISHTVERRDETLVVAFGRNTHVVIDPNGLGHRVWTYIDYRHANACDFRHAGASARWCAIKRGVESVM